VGQVRTALPVEDQAFLDLKAEQIRAVAANAVIEIGRHLIEAKQRVGHGHFLAWVEAEFQWGEQSARNYMAVAERFPQGLGDLPITREALYLLAGPSVPEEAREEAVERAEAGERRKDRRAGEIPQPCGIWKANVLTRIWDKSPFWGFGDFIKIEPPETLTQAEIE
jgi:DUF3102 family protein